MVDINALYQPIFEQMDRERQQRAADQSHWDWDFCVLLEASHPNGSEIQNSGSIFVSTSTEPLAHISQALERANDRLFAHRWDSQDAMVTLTLPFEAFVEDDLSAIDCDGCGASVTREEGQSAEALAESMERACTCGECND